MTDGQVVTTMPDGLHRTLVNPVQFPALRDRHTLISVDDISEERPPRPLPTGGDSDSTSTMSDLVRDLNGGECARPERRQS